MFPERGEETARNCMSGVEPRGIFVGIHISFVKQLRAYIKKVEKLDDKVTSTVYPISYFGKQS